MVDVGRFALDDFRNRRFKLIPNIVSGPKGVKFVVGNRPTLLGQKVGHPFDAVLVCLLVSVFDVVVVEF